MPQEFNFLTIGVVIKINGKDTTIIGLVGRQVMLGNIWLLVALAAGVCATLQSATNGSLSKVVGVSSAVTWNTLVFLALAAVYFFWDLSRKQIDFESFKQVEPAQLLGGIFGFGVVLFLTLCFPRLGAFLTISLMVLGQALAALVVDHFGLLGSPVAPISFQRILAVGLIVAGIAVFRR